MAQSNSALRTRDLLAIGAACVAFFVATHSAPDSSLSLRWYIELPEAPLSFSAAANGLVAPLVTDLDGDGRGEVLVLTAGGGQHKATRLKVYSLPDRSYSGTSDGGGGLGYDANGNLLDDDSPFPEALKATKEADVLSGLAVSAGRKPVALAAGYLDPYSEAEPGEGSGDGQGGQGGQGVAARKQYVAVVREDWTVILLDHNLRVVWETPVWHPTGELGAVSLELRDVAATLTALSPYDAEKGEKGTGGMVVVSGRMRRKADASTGGGGGEHGRPLSDEASAYVEHFSFFALEGRTGKVAWAHEGTAGPSAAEAWATATGTKDRSVPQHQYRLDPTRLSRELGPGHGGLGHGLSGPGLDGDSPKPAGQQLGDGQGEDWTLFRNSVLANLPHGWETRGDTRLTVARLERVHGGGRAAVARMRQKNSASRHGAPTGGSGGSKALGSWGGLGHPAVRLPGLVESTQAAKAALAVSKAYASQAVSSHGQPSRSHGQSAVPLGAHRPHLESEHLIRPNVIFAHSEHGVEAVTLRGGKPVFSLALPQGGLYVDLNGDGVIDHLSTIGRHADHSAHEQSGLLGAHLSGLARHVLDLPPEPEPVDRESGGEKKADAKADTKGWGKGKHKEVKGTSGNRAVTQRSLAARHAGLPPCSALVLSGVPAREQLFNGSLCDGAGAFRDYLNRPERFVDRERDIRGPSKGHKVEVLAAPPCVVRRLSSGSALAAAQASARLLGPKLHGSMAEAGQGGDGRPPLFDAIFAVSNGVVTSYSPTGKLNWQFHDGPTWSEGSQGWAAVLPAPSGDHSDGTDGIHASWHGRGGASGGGGLSAGLSQEILVVGEDRMVVLGARGGRVLAEAPVPEPPRRRPIMGDFDDDGAAEVLLVSEGAIWGYTVTFAPGGAYGGYRIAVMFAIAIAVAIYFTNLQVEVLSGPKGGPKGGRRSSRVHLVAKLTRSTD